MSPDEKRRRLTLMILVTLGYLVAEIIYNVGLVRMLSSPGLSSESIHGMEVVGKSVASIGITLALSRLVPLGRIWRYVVLIALIYWGLGVLIDHEIDQLPEETRQAGHWLGLYRVAILEGKKQAPEWHHDGHELTLEQRLAAANMALMLYGERTAVEPAVRQFVTERVAEKFSAIPLQPSLERFWPTYDRVSTQLHPHWVRYRQHVQQFEHRTPGSSEFVARMEHNAWVGLKVRAYGDMKLFDGNAALGLTPVFARDIPLFLSHEQLKQHFQHLLEQGKDGVMSVYLPGSSASTGLSRDLALSVFVPPVSMSLSLLSIGLNLSVLASLCVAWALVGIRHGNRTIMVVLDRLPLLTMVSVLVVLLWRNNLPFSAESPWQRSVVVAEQHGVWARIWVWAIAHESLLLQSAGQMHLVRSASDRLPVLGRPFRSSEGGVGVVAR